MINKKKQIFEAVINHIKTQGLLRNLTISEIAKNADVGKGTVYEYFTSKDEMIAETIIYMLEEVSQTIFSEGNLAVSFEESLRNHINTVMSVLLDNSTVQTILISEDVGGLINHELKQKIVKHIMIIKVRYHKFIKVILSLGVKEELFQSNDDPFILSAISNVIVSSIMYFIHDSGLQLSEREIFIDKIYQLILKIVS